MLLLITTQSAYCMLYMFTDSSNNLSTLAKHLIPIRVLNNHIVCSSEITFMHFCHLSFQAYLFKILYVKLVSELVIHFLNELDKLV